MRILLALPMVALAGCLASRMQSINSQGTDSSASRFDPAQRLSPTAFEQNATMKDTSVHEDPSLLKVGASRNKITAAYGTPNQIRNQGGQEQDVYEFNPDGSKFVKPKIYARNIATGVCSRVGSRPSCTRPGSIKPNSSSPCITSPTDLMAACSRFKRNRVATPAVMRTHKNSGGRGLIFFKCRRHYWPARDVFARSV